MHARTLGDLRETIAGNQEPCSPLAPELAELCTRTTSGAGESYSPNIATSTGKIRAVIRPDRPMARPE
jgi:hypothetical protein